MQMEPLTVTSSLIQAASMAGQGVTRSAPPVPAPRSWEDMERSDSNVVTDASSDEEGSDACSLGGDLDDVSLEGIFEKVFGYDLAEPGLTGSSRKRTATPIDFTIDFTIDCKPQGKRQKTSGETRWLDPVASCAQELPLTSDYAVNLLQGELLEDDFVTSDFCLSGNQQDMMDASLDLSFYDQDMFECLEALL